MYNSIIKIVRDMENTKKAFLVTLSPMTRVVVDTNGLTEDEAKDEAIRVAIHKMWRFYTQYLSWENLDEIREDLECPAENGEDVTTDEFC